MRLNLSFYFTVAKNILCYHFKQLNGVQWRFSLFWCNIFFERKSRSHSWFWLVRLYTMLLFFLKEMFNQLLTDTYNDKINMKILSNILLAVFHVDWLSKKILMLLKWTILFYMECENCCWVTHINVSNFSLHYIYFINGFL